MTKVLFASGLHLDVKSGMSEVNFLSKSSFQFFSILGIQL